MEVKVLEGPFAGSERLSGARVRVGIGNGLDSRRDLDVGGHGDSSASQESRGNQELHIASECCVDDGVESE